MKHKQLPYKEGDWFAVPLTDGGYGLGLVARMDGQGIVLGHFFGPRRKEVPTEDDVTGLSPKDAVLVCLFGDLGLLRGEWPIIHRSDHWNREDWPMSAFGRVAVDESWASRIEYSEEELAEVIREVPISVEEARTLPEDGLPSYSALEVQLTELLAS